MSPSPSEEVSEPPGREPRTASPRWIGMLLGVVVLGMVAASRSCSPRSVTDPNAGTTPDGATTMPSDL